MEERMMENKLEMARKAAGQFQMDGEVADIQSYGNGHINDTYLVHVKNGENVKRMILQGINTGCRWVDGEHPESNFLFERRDRKGRGRSGEGDFECSAYFGGKVLF